MFYDKKSTDELVDIGTNLYNIGAYEKAFDFFCIAVSEGSVRAFYILATMYEDGKGVAKSEDEAIKLYNLIKKGAKAGHSDAQYNIGCMYLFGRGITKDYREALKWNNLSIIQGNLRALHNLAWMHMEGIGVEKNQQEGIRLYLEAAEHNFPPSQYNLGMAYAKGTGVEINLQEAVRLYRMAAEQGIIGAQNDLGVAYAKGFGVEVNVQEAVYWYQIASEQGAATSQNNLASMYEYRVGVPQDNVQAVQLYRLSADQGYKDARVRLTHMAEKGDILAQFNIGWIYVHGKVVDKDYARAISWFQKAGELVDSAINSAIMITLGIFYEYELGQNKEINKAIQYYKTASLNEHPLAQILLGISYFNGYYQSINAEEAEALFFNAKDKGEKFCNHPQKDWVILFKSLVDQDNVNAFIVLTLFYEKGLFGISIDKEKAFCFHRKYIQCLLKENGISGTEFLAMKSNRPNIGLLGYYGLFALIKDVILSNRTILSLHGYPELFSGDKWENFKQLILENQSPGLQKLDFSHNQLQDQHIPRLLSMVHAIKSLTHIILDFNYLTFNGMKAFLKGLSDFPHGNLKHISFCGNRINEMNRRIFADSMVGLLSGNLRQINLSLNFMTDPRMAVYSVLPNALLAVLRTLSCPLRDVRNIQIRFLSRHDDELWLGFITDGHRELHEVPIKFGDAEMLIHFKERQKKTPLHMNEVSDELLRRCVEPALEDYPELLDINIIEKSISEQKEIVKKLVRPHPEMPLKYLIARHSIFYSKPIIDNFSLPSYLKTGFEVTIERWIVYLMVKKNSEHAYLAWEGVYRHGQRFFNRAHLIATGDGSLLSRVGLRGIPKIEWALPKLQQNPNWFESAHQYYYIAAFYGTKKQIKQLAANVLFEIENGLSAVYNVLSCRSPGTKEEEVLNCLMWVINKINEYLEFPVTTRINGAVPSHVAMHYEKITHDEALDQFEKRQKNDIEKNLELSSSWQCKVM